MAELTWESLEKPILEAVAALEDTEPSLGLATIAAHTGLPLEQVRIGVRRLFGEFLTASCPAIPCLPSTGPGHLELR